MSVQYCAPMQKALILSGIVLIALLCGSHAQSAPGYPQTDNSKNYIRPTGSSGVPLTDPRLAFKGTQGQYTPEQIHVSLGPPNTVYITWVTGQSVQTNLFGSCSSPNPNSVATVVKYGTSSSSLATTASGTSTTYQQSAVLPSYGEAYCSGIIHTALVQPLQPSKTYYYQVGDPAHELSPTFSFTMPPAAGAADTFPYTFVMTADVGQTYNSTATLDHIAAEKPNMTILWGDVSYADDYNGYQRNGYQLRWDSWGRLTQPIFANSIFMSLVGNHEIEPEVVPPRTFKSYITRYPAPYQASGSPSPQYYSFNAAGAHFVMLSTYSNSLPFVSDQYNWLVQDLQRYDRTRTPWLIAGFHEPYYNSNTEQYLEAKLMQKDFESLFLQYGVDIVFTGHVHAYERTYPVYNNQINTCGPVYFVIGDGGNEEGLTTGYTYPQPAWSAFREPSFGFGLLTLKDAQTAEWVWHRNQDGLAQVADSYTIMKASNCQNHGGTVAAAAVGPVHIVAQSAAATLVNSTVNACDHHCRRRLIEG